MDDKEAKRMKSIKEKAQEWVDMYPSCGMADKSFEAGANCVLEEIEKLVKTTNGDGETYHYNLYIGLVKLLEQLKK